MEEKGPKANPGEESSSSGFSKFSGKGDDVVGYCVIFQDLIEDGKIAREDKCRAEGDKEEESIENEEYRLKSKRK